MRVTIPGKLKWKLLIQGLSQTCNLDSKGKQENNNSNKSPQLLIVQAILI